MSWWDKVSEKVNDGFGDLIEAGIDRAAQEIAPTKAGSVSQNPNTHAVEQNVGRNADGTTVATPINRYGLVNDPKKMKWLLIGSVSLLGVGLFLKFKK